VKQTDLNLELEASNPPPVVLDKNIQAELVAQLAVVISTVHQKELEKTHAGDSSTS
jgi:hypothetical protein